MNRGWELSKPWATWKGNMSTSIVVRNRESLLGTKHRNQLNTGAKHSTRSSSSVAGGQPSLRKGWGSWWKAKLMPKTEEIKKKEYLICEVIFVTALCAKNLE